MDFMLCCFGFILSITSTSAFHDTTVEDYYDYTSDDDFKQTKPPAPTNTRTQAPLARYEVTEEVEDIPYPSPPPIPVSTNFTLNKPLNIAGGNSTGNPQVLINRENPKFRKDFANIRVDVTKPLFQPNLDAVPIPNQNPNNKPTSDSKFELDDDDSDKEDDSEFESDDVGHNHEGFHHIPNILPVIRRYLYGLEKGIINGLNSLAGKDVFKGTRVNERDNILTPVSMLHKLKYRKGHVHDEKNLHSHFDQEFNDY